MNNLDEFIKDVKKNISIDFKSYCPQCYSLPAILNSHKCREGWEIWYNSPLEYNLKVKLCVDHITKISATKFYPEYIDNSLKVGEKTLPQVSKLKLDINEENNLPEKKEFYLMLLYMIIITLGSLWIAYHTPLDQ
jgi:hypothetical protein